MALGIDYVFVNLMSFFGQFLIYGLGIGLPIIVLGIVVGLNVIFKYRVIIHQPLGKILFTKGYVTKKGQFIIKKPKYKMQAFSWDLCSIGPKGKYVFHLYQENADTFRQVKPTGIDSSGRLLMHEAQDKSIDFLVETWKTNQKTIFSLEGFEKIKDLVFLGLIIVFNVISMSLLFKAAGLST